MACLKKLWKIKEFFYGTGKHKIEILMHTMPDIVIDIINYKALKMSSKNEELMLNFSPGLEISVSDSHYSPSYNVIQKNKRICLTTEIDLDAGIKLINYEIAPL